MINALLNGLLSFFTTVLGALCSPIDSIISQYVPELSTGLTMFGNFINSILQFFPWLLSYLKIPPTLLNFLLTWLIAKLWLNFSLHFIKIVLAWWRTLKI